MTDAVLLLIAAGVLADVWLGAYVFLRLRRRYVRAAFVLLAADAALAAATFAGSGTGIGLLGPSWDAVALWSFGLTHPLLALYVLLSIHGVAALRRHAYVLGLFAPAPVLAALFPPPAVTVALAYQANWLSTYLVVCLALGLAEAIAWWRATDLHRAEAFGLVLATTIAIVTGPAYSFELQFLNVASGQGANPGMPLALAVFAFAALRANPLPVPPPSPATTAKGRFPAGRVAVLDEVRPTYAAHLAANAARAGQPVLVVGRQRRSRLPSVEAPPRPTGPARVSATVRDFAGRCPGGLVSLQELGEISAIAGVAAAVELASEARALARQRRIGLVVSLAELTDREKADVAARLGPAVAVPRPEVEIHAIIGRAMGSATDRILTSYAASRGIRGEDLTPDDVSPVADYLRKTLADLARVLDDEPVVLGWRKETDRIALELDRFGRMGLDELAKGYWPSKAAKRPEDEYLVRAADYWKDRNLEDALATAAARSASLALGERVRDVFLASLGPAGSHLFEMELRRLKRSARDLTHSDVRAIAASSEHAAVELASAIDVAAGRADLEARVRELRGRLLELAGDGA